MGKVQEGLRKFALSSTEKVSRIYNQKLSHLKSPDPESQLLLMLQYRQMMHRGEPLPRLEEVGFKRYSQYDEDGILLYIFSLIGMTTRSSVELCVESGVECNSANLIINHGWDALLFDGSPENIRQGIRFYAYHSNTYLVPPSLVAAWIDADNINKLVSDNGFAGKRDLLSLDIDGVDYWVWKSLNSVDATVVVTEINPGLGAEAAITIPYQPDFVWKKHDPVMRHYYGASLMAMIKLASEKGYRFVGMNGMEHNAFFIKRSVGEDVLPERNANEYLKRPYSVKKQNEAVTHQIRNKEWVEV